MGLDADALAAFVTESCERQGVPVKVTDALVVDRVSALLGAGAPGPGRQAGRTDRPLQTPDRFDSGVVESSGTRRSRSDDDVVDHGADDGGLTGEVEIGPVAS